MKDKNNTSKSTSKSTTSKILSSASIAVAAVSPPTAVSAENLAEYSRLSEPATAQIQQLNNQISSEISNAKTISKLADNYKAQLILAIEKSQTAEANKNTVEAIAKKIALLPIPPALKPEKGKDHFTIKSEGDMFFDANKGIMVFSKQVTVTHPEYNFTCDGEVKVILAPKPTRKKSDPAKKEKLKPNDKFGDISKIIATDNIAIVGKDKDGNPVAARAGNLIYDHTTGGIILRGLHSRITLVDKQMKITEKNGHIRIDRNWNVTGKGTQVDLNLEKIQNSKKEN